MSRYFFCAHAYPTCDDSTSSIKYQSYYNPVKSATGYANCGQSDAGDKTNSTTKYVV